MFVRVVLCDAELAQQVGRVVRALSQAGLRVRSAVMTGGQQEADRRSKTFRTQVRMSLLCGGGGGGGVVVCCCGFAAAVMATCSSACW
jgi:hypothetical protein